MPRSSVTVGYPKSAQLVVPELVNCSAAISCPALAEPRNTRTEIEVHVDLGGGTVDVAVAEVGLAVELVGVLDADVVAVSDGEVGVPGGELVIAVEEFVAAWLVEDVHAARGISVASAISPAKTR